MGVGDSLEAEFTLVAPIGAGDWTLVGDGLILEPVDVRFELLWRDAAGEHPIVTFEHHFELPPGDPFDAVHYEETLPGLAVTAAAGDELVLRMQAPTATLGLSYILNGDGAAHGGRIPFLTLP